MQENLALLISSGGTTATAIVNACKQDDELNSLVSPKLVVASRPGIPGIGRLMGTLMFKAEDIIVLRRQDFDSLEDFGYALICVCEARGITLFGQYGWAVKTPENFLKMFPRGINQHPAPLCPGKPDFGGHGMLGRACHLARLLFVRMTGRDFWTRAVAQRVHPEYDKGAVLRQEDVPILPNDDVDTLAARVLPIEHRVQIAALKDFATGQVHEVAVEEIVRPHEMLIWRIACEMGKLAYPKG